jgi:hypothetical protein
MGIHPPRVGHEGLSSRSCLTWTATDASQLNPPPRSSSLGRHLREVAAQYPLYKFEKRMLQFLEACHNGIPRPVLVQAESGQIEGLTEEQTQTLLDRTDMRIG